MAMPGEKHLVESQFHGCERSVSRSNLHLLRLVCDTTAPKNFKPENYRRALTFAIIDPRRHCQPYETSPTQGTARRAGGANR